jgi:hypothetical protein
MNTKVYQDLKSGDLLFFLGNSFTSRLITTFTESIISHVGVVYKCPISGKVYVWETGDIDLEKNCLPIISKGKKAANGAHLIGLEKKLIGNYYTAILVKKLTGDLDHRKLDVFIAKNLGKPYTINMVNSWCQRFNLTLISLPFIEDYDEFQQDEDGQIYEYSDWMCSQLVALTYIHLGVIKRLDDYSHLITPYDMKNVVTTNGFRFEPFEIVFIES